MIRTDLHVHTRYSDGKGTPKEVVQAALALGMETLGFSDHSFTSFDQRYCMSRQATRDYRREIEELKARCAPQLRILCGIEQDYYSDDFPEGFDFVIGSVHYLKLDDEYLTVDESPELLLDAAQRHFGGDIYALAEAYYRTVADVVRRTGASVIGHFDLIAKFNEGGALFDEDHPRYRAAWQQAADRLLESGVPFEINTGAMSRGWRSVPYPAAPIRDYLRQRGGRFLLSSDSHDPATLCHAFGEMEPLL